MDNLSITTNYQDLELLAKLMDDQFEIFGFHFGLSFIIDLLPEIGDVITTVIALYIFYSALKYRLSAWAVSRMVFNIAVYFVIGLVPYLGDFFGAWWKPNRRNLRILQNQLK